MLDREEIDQLQTLGITDQGAAIVDVIWFTPGDQKIGMVLICNPERIWKAYIYGVIARYSDNVDAKTVSNYGSKLSYAIAAAAFPNRFTEDEYGK